MIFLLEDKVSSAFSVLGDEGQSTSRKCCKIERAGHSVFSKLFTFLKDPIRRIKKHLIAQHLFSTESVNLKHPGLSAGIPVIFESVGNLYLEKIHSGRACGWHSHVLPRQYSFFAAFDPVVINPILRRELGVRFLPNQRENCYFQLLIYLVKIAFISGSKLFPYEAICS